jgi:XTP/dITP diphosphohydrolase
MSQKRILLATGNKKKGQELTEILGADFSVSTLADVGLTDLDIVEDGDTFAENARIKVDAVVATLRQRGDLDDFFGVLGDDSGIEVDALDGAPGINSARFAENHDAGCGDADNNFLLLKMMHDLPENKRQARFVCHLCLFLIHVQKWHTAEGTVEGQIAEKERGNGGFGYDPLFLPGEAPGRHMAELTPANKHTISHRGRAMRKIAAILGPTH